MTVFLTTHYLEEAEKAQDVVIMDKGNIIAHGTPNELKNLYSSDRIVCYRERDEAFDLALGKEGRRFSFDDEHGCYRIDITGGEDAKALLVKFGAYIEDFEILKGNMDDVFLNVTGQNIVTMGGENG